MNESQGGQGVREESQGDQGGHGGITGRSGRSGSSGVPVFSLMLGWMQWLIGRAQQIAEDRDSGASALAARLLPLLAEAIQAGEAVTLDIVRVICSGQPAMAPLWNACAA